MNKQTELELRMGLFSLFVFVMNLGKIEGKKERMNEVREGRKEKWTTRRKEREKYAVK